MGHSTDITTIETLTTTYTITSSSGSKRTTKTKTEHKTTSMTTQAATTGGLDGIMTKNSNSTQLGLAIGIPAAVIGLLIVFVGGFIYFKKRSFSKNRDKMLSYKTEYFNYEPKQRLEQQPNPYNPPKEPYTKPYQQLQPEPRRSMADFLKNRVSKVFDFPRDPPREGAEPKSPLFLRKFNLKKPVDSPVPQFVSLPYNDSKQTVQDPKPPVKLPKLINMVTLSLDESVYSRDSVLVVKPYRKLLKDELDVNVGDRVVILERHSENWCKVKLDNKEGVVPRSCLHIS